MVENKFIVEQLIEFHKYIDDLKNIEINIEDEDNDIFLLSSLLISFEHFKDALLYGIESIITLDKVQMTVKFKEYSNMKDLKIDDSGKILSISRGGSCQGGLDFDGLKWGVEYTFLENRPI